MKFRIAVGDDNPIRRDGLTEILNQEKICVHESCSLSAISNTDFYITDILLLVVDHSIETIFSIIKQSKLSNSRLKVIVMDDVEGIQNAVRFFRIGINGYLTKNLRKEELLFALKYVYEGNSYVDADLTTKLFRKLSEFEKHMTTFNTDLTLTEKEREVLDLMVYGYANRDIAYRLFTTKRKIEEIREQLIEKTGARDNLGLILYRLHEEFIRH